MHNYRNLIWSLTIIVRELRHKHCFNSLSSLQCCTAEKILELKTKEKCDNLTITSLLDYSVTSWLIPAKDDFSECVMCVFQSQSLLQLRSEMLFLQSELQCLSSTQQGELQAERDLNRTLQEKCQVSALVFTFNLWHCP